MKYIIKYTIGLPILILFSIGAIADFIIGNICDLIIRLIDYILNGDFYYRLDTTSIYDLIQMWKL
jgi:hypothetical protein